MLKKLLGFGSIALLVFTFACIGTPKQAKAQEDPAITCYETYNCNTFEGQVCVNPGTTSSYCGQGATTPDSGSGSSGGSSGPTEAVTCNANYNCNTIHGQVCMNPGTTESYCAGGGSWYGSDIACGSNSDCIGGQVCVNAGTESAYCTAPLSAVNRTESTYYNRDYNSQEEACAYSSGIWTLGSNNSGSLDADYCSCLPGMTWSSGIRSPFGDYTGMCTPIPGTSFTMDGCHEANGFTQLDGSCLALDPYLNMDPMEVQQMFVDNPNLDPDAAQMISDEDWGGLQNYIYNLVNGIGFEITPQQMLDAVKMAYPPPQFNAQEVSDSNVFQINTSDWNPTACDPTSIFNSCPTGQSCRNNIVLGSFCE